MNWDAIGAIGQAVSALALVIVIVQVRHARSESRRAISQGRNEALHGLIFHRNEARITDVYTKAAIKLGAPIRPLQSALMERAGLTREDAFVVGNVLYAWWTYRLQIIPNVNELSAMERTAFDVAMRADYGQPGPGRVFYEASIKATAHTDAVRYIDNLLAQPG